MKVSKNKRAVIRRKHHVRKNVFGTTERPRLSVFRSNRQIYAQIIDDTAGVTLVCASTKSKGLKSQLAKTRDKKAAEAVGESLAKQAIGVGIKCVCFDRNRFKYHGRVRALAEGARKGGLVF
jgi:large subunit ribosomal protein L18